MIDIEPEVTANVKRRLPAGVHFSAAYQPRPAKFPHVSAEETANTVYAKTQDSASLENHASVGYEVNIYSNKEGGKKTEARALLAVVDAGMAEMGFSRIYCQPIPNLADATVYRVVARYAAVVDNEHRIYQK